LGAGPQSSRYDVVVIGAGVIGLSCAWRAARRGLSVLVVDRAEPGAGASGVAAGMLAPVTEAEWGEEELLELNLAGASAWPSFAAELEEEGGTPSGYVESGALVVAADRDDAEELRRLLAFQRSIGLEAEWLSGRACRRLEPGLSPRVPGGIDARGDHQADPRATALALLRALAHAGGELLSGHSASVALRGERAVGVELEGFGRVEAGSTVVATGAWTSALAGVPPEALPPVRPVKGQILRLRRPPTAPVLAERLIRTPRCYVVARPSGEVVIGATVEERGFDDRVTAEGVYVLLEAAREVLPDVGELEWVEARAGLRPGTPDNAPVVGADVDVEGLVWATGHYRNGILLAPLTGEAVAALLAGESLPEVMRGFGPGRFGREARPEGPGTAAAPGSSALLSGSAR